MSQRQAEARALLQAALWAQLRAATPASLPAALGAQSRAALRAEPQVLWGRTGPPLRGLGQLRWLGAMLRGSGRLQGFELLHPRAPALLP